MSYRQKRDLYWDAIDGIQAANKALEALASVSYTHLTLPTNREV